MYTISSKFSVSLVLVSLFSNIVFPKYGLTDSDLEEIDLMSEDSLATVQGQALIQPGFPYVPEVVAQNWVTITAYSSTPDQTDSTPFITASGKTVCDGIVACNFLSFGTKVRFPELYGDKIFVVEDRMALHNSHKIDIWFSTRWEAKQFGVKITKVEVLGT
jgi:3D (Asp-Asp-Asp) domain-containing protein